MEGKETENGGRQSSGLGSASEDGMEGSGIKAGEDTADVVESGGNRDKLKDDGKWNRSGRQISVRKSQQIRPAKLRLKESIDQSASS